MKKVTALCLLAAMVCMLAACNTSPAAQAPTSPATQTPTTPSMSQLGDAIGIALSDGGITVDGNPVSNDSSAAVYTANDIIYYESGKDFTYGEGSEKDAHTPEEAAAHTVVHISQPGTYSISGTLSLGQIAVDLGDDAKKDPDAVVTLILNGADITCEVAPAVIFYNVYECGDDDTDKATKDVDTSAAGANVIIADGTVNNINGSYVEKIYKPESVVLNDNKTEVEDASKLHKYDGAFYSKRSMNIYGGDANTGVLNITAANEGLDSELHLTINGGNIHIASGNDGINTNEDEVSVTTVNGGTLTIRVTGETGEGDGIDSNGWLVINGGTVIAAACSNSADAGIDSDMGIHINGGTVIATGHMLDRIEDGGQNYAVFNFAQKQQGNETVTLKDKDGNSVFEVCPENAYSILIYSSPELKADTYTLWSNGQQLTAQSGGMSGRPGMFPGGDMTPPERPSEDQRPEDAVSPELTPPEGFDPASGFERPEGETPPEMPDGNKPGFPGENNADQQEQSPNFIIRDGGNMFSGVRYLD